jgi:8-oxo-dGTP pyrophosphatase MutT (NUDIX family)
VHAGVRSPTGVGFVRVTAAIDEVVRAPRAQVIVAGTAVHGVFASTGAASVASAGRAPSRARQTAAGYRGEVELPADLPLVERRVVRLVVLDIAERVLLFHTRDSTDPALGTCWELPGGGIEPGETHVDAAVRELREETGIAATAEQVGRPTWRRDATYRYRGERRLQHERVVTVRLPGPTLEVDAAGRDDHERADCLGWRWWNVNEVVESNDRFYPVRLPQLLPRFLAGDEIDEPFERWS